MPEKARRTAPAGSRNEGSGPLPAETPLPKFSVKGAGFASARADVAVCFAFENDRSPRLPGAASGRLTRLLARLMRDARFKGKRREVVFWQSGGQFPAAYYAIVGLGPKARAGGDAMRDACGLVARRAAGARARKMVIALPEAQASTSWADLAEAATEGICLGAYRMTKYLTVADNRGIPLTGVDLLVPKNAVAQAQAGTTRGAVRGRAVALTRDLVNEPAGSLTPSLMADVARGVAKQHGLEITVIDRAGLAKMGMGAILGVSSGSAEPPCLIHLVYRPRGPAKPGRTIALVGKGLTFDSGGLSLKTAGGMETMKLDKAGASAVLSVMSALPDLAPPVVVHGIMGMTENMPGGAALKPGDVLKTTGGKTIEVLNTDAEGRLVLADALAYAQRQNVDEIID
ncbi:MAG TPA: M17 family peptidase N-terminal domain-containing protein, partial [Candidatus Polarisedimenticolia bacterium]|nr:M17 family peptidase N-terminal domain-containing protein [Candidatus Polarisedimenticolia bacterium]